VPAEVVADMPGHLAHLVSDHGFPTAPNLKRFVRNLRGFGVATTVGIMLTVSSSRISQMPAGELEDK